MSAIAIALAEMGHAVSGSDLREHAGARSAACRRRRRCTSATTARYVARRRRRHRLDRHPGAANIELDEARHDSASRCCAAPGMLASICARARLARPSPARTARRRRRRCSMLILAEAGLRPSFVVGGDVTDVGTGRALDRRRAGSSSRPTRATAPTSSCRCTARSSPTSRPTTSTTTARSAASSTASTATSAQSHGPKVVCADDPVAAAAWRAATAPSRTGRRAGADVPRRRRRPPSGGSLEFDVEHHGERARRPIEPAAARRAQRAQRHGGAGDGAGARRAVRSAAPRRWPASAASPAASTSAASTAAPRSSTTTPTCRARSRPCSPRPASGDGWRADRAVFQPNRFNRMAEICGRVRRRVRRRRRRGAHRHLRLGRRHPIPGVTGKLVVDAVLRRPSGAADGVAAAPRRPRSIPRRRARPGRRLHLDGLRRRRYLPDGGARCPARRLTARCDPSRRAVEAVGGGRGAR